MPSKEMLRYFQQSLYYSRRVIGTRQQSFLFLLTRSMLCNFPLSLTLGTIMLTSPVLLSITVGPVIEMETELVIISKDDNKPTFWRAYGESIAGTYHWMFDAPDEGIARFLAGQIAEWQKVPVENEWYGPDRIPKSREQVMKITCPK
jgi:hypothetical protein